MSNLEFVNLSVSYGTEPVLDDLTFVVESGSWVSVIGPNGAGKSTLLRALVGLVPFEGSISIDGTATGQMDRRQLARALAYVAQTPARPSGMSVFDYVMLGRTPHRSYLGSIGRTDLDIVREVVSLLDLDQLAARPLTEVSGGEAQRAAIARAIVQRSPVLILDEPTSSLDIAHQQEVMNLVDSLRRSEGLTVLTTMHDLTIAGQYADRLLLLSDTRIQKDGPPSTVLTVDAMQRYYGSRVSIIESADGAIAVVPLRFNGQLRSMTP